MREKEEEFDLKLREVQGRVLQETSDKQALEE